ncbi:MAG: 16S rRNA (cytosine(1402)-N(4))-methyltransferase RsmH [Thermoleophilia bacterium]|jgi:16S rRNA (cytosine1402-N4)-methyltransferase|nr:16S rRNA (cytosine(1402)-N(4))-methyltransferase RsmH [Thermoleophilia bacterium]
MPANAAIHDPVLAHEVVALLDVQPGMTVVDGTFGAGGHATMLAELMQGRGAYVAIDRDPSVENRARSFRASHPDMAVRLLKRDFVDAFRSLAIENVEADAILLDLGVSSMQIDQPERGFSYAVDAPLDMRMDPRGGDTAADLLANLSERELADMFSRYGEERYSRQIARAICRRRMSLPYERSADLVDTIRHAIPTPAQFGSGHPAKRVFQALRIAVNDELAMVEDGLDAAMQILKPGGRIAVISFHSLEDRIVKERFRDASAPCTCPPDLPICGCNREATLRVLTPRVIRPGSSELDRNPRAASSRLRVAERTPAALPKDAA